MKKLILCGKEIKIIKKKNMLAETYTYAQYHNKIKTIQIDASLKGREYTQTMIHEIIHAFCDVMHFHQMPCWDGNVEELLAEGFSNALLDNYNLSKR